MSERLSLPSEIPEGLIYTDPDGLSSEEAERRRERGEGNVTAEHQEKPFSAIFRDNTFTLFNLLNAGLAVALALAGSYRNMLFLGVVISNILIGTIQEAKAQKTIRRLKLLNAPEVSVIRDGREMRASKERACHVLDVQECLVKSHERNGVDS